MKSIIITALLMYLAAMLGMFIFQRQMLYFPTPAPVNLSHDAMQIDSQDHSIQVLAYHTERPHALIYFGGNAEDMHNSHALMDQAFNGFASYYLNYPGYAGSQGEPSEQSILAAAEALYQQVSARHQSVALVGRSLGTGPACDLASRHPVANLVLISPYDSIAAVAFNHYPIFPMSLLVKDKFDSIGKAERITANTLVMLAAWDKVVPVTRSQVLIDGLINAQVEVVPFANADHNSLPMQADFSYRINDFLKDGIKG